MGFWGFFESSLKTFNSGQAPALVLLPLTWDTDRCLSMPLFFQSVLLSIQSCVKMPTDAAIHSTNFSVELGVESQV